MGTHWILVLPGLFVSWPAGVHRIRLERRGAPLTLGDGQEVFLEIFLVSPDGTQITKDRLQVRKHLNERRPRLHLWWRRPSIQLGAQHAVTTIQTAIEPIAGIQ